MEVTVDFEDIINSGCEGLIRKTIKNHASKILANYTHDGKVDITKIKFLLDHGLDINTKFDTNLHTLLRIGCFSNNIDLIKFLLDNGANVNITDIHNWSSLMFAAHYGHFEVIKLLLEKGCDVNIISKRGSSALSLACSVDLHNTTKIIELLMQNEAKINEQVLSECRPINKKSLLYYKQKIYYGINCSDKLDIKLPDIIEMKRNNQYYYVYKMTRKDDGYYLQDQENKRLILKSLATDIDVMTYYFNE